jgi:hypothetical protein
MCGSHWANKEQEYMSDGYGIDRVKEEDDGVVTLGGGRTFIYVGDEDGIGQVKKEGKGQSLVEASWTRVNIG